MAGEVMEGSATLKMRGTRKPGNMRRDGVVEIMGTESEGERVGKREYGRGKGMERRRHKGKGKR